MALLIKKFLTLLFLFQVFANSDSAKLNVARILLPIFNDFSVNFTIVSTEQACLKWSLSRDDVVTLKQIDYNSQRGCSDMAVVSSCVRDLNRVSTEITVEETDTKQQLRCVATVDEIHSLAITTKSRELTLEEAPVAFEVRAYDSQGNEFSTLDGVPFKWTIKSLGSQKDSPVVRIAPFGDSQYNTEVSILDLENRGLLGNLILLEGVRTGMAKVSVQLAQKEYSRVAAKEVIINVLNNVIIYPLNLYMMLNDDCSLKVMQSSFGKFEPMDLTGSSYYFQIENSDVIKAGSKVGEFTSLAFGSTKVYLRDQTLDADIEFDEDGNQYIAPFPSAHIHVVEAAYMQLSLQPYRNWATFVNAHHAITAEIYTGDAKMITLGSAYDVKMTVGDAFRLEHSTKNGTYNAGWAVRTGSAPVKATLDQVDPALTAHAEILIFPTISINPSEVILPWDPSTKPQYDIYLKATGGDGKFLWTTTNNSIGVVTQYGRVHTMNHGSFQVAASMHRNHHNRQVSNFHIIPPNKLEIVEQVMEAEVNTPIFIHIALYGAKRDHLTEGRTLNVPITLCQDLPFTITVSNPNVVVNNTMSEKPIGTACGTIALIGSEIGSAKVTIGFPVGSDLLHDSATIYIHKPLVLVAPRTPIVLAVGSSANLIFSGGRSHNQKGPNKMTVEIANIERLKAVDTTELFSLPKDDDYSVVSVTCLKLGESVLNVKSCTKQTMPNCKEGQGTLSVPIYCGKPRKLELQPEIKVADARACPMDLNSEKVIVQSNQDVELLVKLYDEQGREFLNFTSLHLNFETYHPDYAQIDSPNSVLENVGLLGNVPFPNKTYQKITPKIESGEVKLVVSILGYKENVLDANSIKAERPNFVDAEDGNIAINTITASRTLILVGDTVVIPDTISLYNHPKNVIKLDVRQGSGYYSISLNNENVAKVRYLEFTRQLEITPLTDGELLIKLTDLCLINKPATVAVTVMSVTIIKVDMSDKVEIGKCISCTVHLQDSHGNSLAVPNSEFIKLSHHIDNKIASIEKSKSTSISEHNGQLKYTITGSDLGDAKIRFFIGEPSEKGYVSSALTDLQVFPPLRFMPRQMTLAVGAEMQFLGRGGPQPAADLVFSAQNEKIAKVSTNGLVMGADPGETKVVGKSIGMLPTGKKTVYGEDSVDVNVINISGIRIHAPLTRFKIGSTIPLMATGFPEQITPLILGTINPPIVFSWAVQDAHMAKIYDIVYSTLIDSPSPNLLAVRLRALRPGKTVVSLNATLRVNGRSVLYTSQVDVEIMDPFKLIHPIEIKMDTLFIAPFSTTQLKTNLDALGTVSYKLVGEITASTQIQSTSAVGTSLHVSPSGLVHSFGDLGTSTIIATAVNDVGAKQTAIIPIEVKPIHCLIMKVSSNWRLITHTSSLQIPLGTRFDLEALFYDNIGNQLIGSGPHLFVRTSRHDLATVQRTDNNTFSVVTKKRGAMVLQLGGTDRIVDYLKLNISQVIRPLEGRVTVGDVLCYNTPVEILGEPGTWSTPDCTVMVVDQVKGIATALKPGKSAIFHSHHPFAPLPIEIEPIRDIRLSEYSTTFTNAQEFRLYMHLVGQSLRRHNNLITNYDCSDILKTTSFPSPVKCTLTFAKQELLEEYFRASVKFDERIGKHYCSIEFHKHTNSKKKPSHLPSSDAILTVTADHVEPKVIKLKFVPGIECPDRVKLEEGSLSGSLSITGAPDALNAVTVRSVDDSFVSIGDRNQDGNTITYQVQLNNYEHNTENLKKAIEVNSMVSNQHKLVDITLENLDHISAICSGIDSSKSIWTFIQSNRQVLATAAAILFAILISTYAYVGRLHSAHPPVNVSVCTTHGESISSSTPITPIRSFNTSSFSPSSFNQSSNLEASCYCTKSPEIRRNRRYL